MFSLRKWTEPSTKTKLDPPRCCDLKPQVTAQFMRQLLGVPSGVQTLQSATQPALRTDGGVAVLLERGGAAGRRVVALRARRADVVAVQAIGHVEAVAGAAAERQFVGEDVGAEGGREAARRPDGLVQVVLLGVRQDQEE